MNTLELFVYDITFNTLCTSRHVSSFFTTPSNKATCLMMRRNKTWRASSSDVQLLAPIQ